MENEFDNNMGKQAREIIRNYYEDRADNTIISFGNAGRRVLENIMPLEYRRAVYHSVVRNKTGYHVNINNDRFTDTLEIVGPEPMEVELVSKLQYDQEKARKVKLVERDPVKISETIIDYNPHDFSAAITAKEIFSEMDKSNSFILVSGFGGQFAQPLHIAFSKLLASKNITYYNFVVKPSGNEYSKRHIAEIGLRELSNINHYIKEYDNDIHLGPLNGTMAQISEKVKNLNIRIARDLEVVSTRMSGALELLRLQLIS
jgi:cell division GTPase FtsZ